MQKLSLFLLLIASSSQVQPMHRIRVPRKPIHLTRPLRLVYNQLGRIAVGSAIFGGLANNTDYLQAASGILNKKYGSVQHRRDPYMPALDAFN